MNDMLQMVLANPADDTARLAYADWLEENGQTEQAAFIRQNPWEHPIPSRRTKEGRRLYDYARNCLGNAIPKSWSIWVVSYPDAISYPKEDWSSRWGSCWFSSEPHLVLGLRYGFVSAIAADRIRLLKVLPQIVKLQPIHQVSVTGMFLENAHYEVVSLQRQRFEDVNHEEVVIRLRADHIPQPVFDKLSSHPQDCLRRDTGCVYPNREAAYVDLGRAYLEWAREQP